MTRHGLNTFGGRFQSVNGKLDNAPNDEPHQGETKDHRPDREEHGKHGQDGTRQDYHAETQKSQPADLPKNDPGGFQVLHDDDPKVRGNTQRPSTFARSYPPAVLFAGRGGGFRILVKNLWGWVGSAREY